MKAEEKAKYPLAPLVVLSMVVGINDLDLSILRGVLPFLEKEWGLSDFELGLLGFAYIFVHTIAAIPAGWIADNYRRIRIIGWTLLSWSALSAFSAIAINYINLLIARASLGIGQAIDDPASTSLLSDYYPPERRGRVFSWVTVASFVGSGFGLGLGGLVGAQLGWRWAFALIGMPGSVLAILVFRLRETKRGEADGVEIQTQERDRTLGFGAFVSMATRQLAREIKSIFGIKTMRYILTGVGALLFTVSGVGYWLAIYHERYSGMTAAQATGVTAGVLAIGGVAGTLWGGRIADRVYGRVRGGRIVVVSTGILICTGLFLISYNVPIVSIRILIQAVGVFAIASAVPGIRASMMDVLPVQSRGMGSSAFALVAALFGTALAPPLVGLLSDLMSSLLAAFYIVTPPVAIGALILLRARDTIEEDARAIIAAYMQQVETEAEAPASSDGASPLPDSEVVASDRVPTADQEEETEPSPT